MLLVTWILPILKLVHFQVIDDCNSDEAHHFKNEIYEQRSDDTQTSDTTFQRKAWRFLE